MDMVLIWMIMVDQAKGNVKQYLFFSSFVLHLPRWLVISAVVRGGWTRSSHGAPPSSDPRRAPQPHSDPDQTPFSDPRDLNVHHRTGATLQ